MIQAKLCRLALLAGLLGSLSATPAAALDKISIVIFGPPSLGAFLPPVIKNQKFDEKNGLDIDFQQRPPDAYTAQFNSGEFQVGGSAAVLTVGQADVRGVKVAYLFNLFDYWGTVVTARPEIKTVKDLEGKDLAAARGTTNFLMFDWFARQQGLDLSKVSVLNTATPGLVGYAIADRASAVQLWEPAYTVLLSKKPGLHTLDLEVEKRWKPFAGSSNIPYLGVAAHISWIEQHRDLVPKLFAAYKAAADWIVAHPDEAAKLISPKGTAEDQGAIAALIKANDRLG
ncbi:MAG TPA: ABC transporter substrate-binding protein, partial [Xanthobacteraceae bacterium]|nr:ABC transporter substrate-binding protein [Xanthobacteraceae bacterium]